EFVARVNQAGSNEVSRLDGFDAPTSKLFEFFDRDEIARLFALDLCVGDPWHTSGVHNHFWYEDSSSGLLHPIPWDLRMLDLERPPPGAQFNRFWRAALRDPRVFATALREIYERNNEGALLKRVTERIEATWQLYRDGFEYDQLRCGPTGTAANSDVGSPEEVLGLLRKNLATLETWTTDARASFSLTSLDEDTLVLDVLVDGRAPVLCRLIEHPTLKTRHTMRADADLDGVPSSGDRPVVHRPGSFNIDVEETLVPGVRAGKRLDSEPILYRYFLQGSGVRSSSIDLSFQNDLTGALVKASKLEPGTVVPATTSAHPWSFREPPVVALRLSGKVLLSKTLEVPRNTTLTIEPGTAITLEPDVSIHCLGRIQAFGTEAAPISFSSSDPRRPWGSLALQGSGASDSAFSHVHFSGGGGALLDDVEYTGMVCVHWARNVLFRDCEFSGNQRCDDALHADLADVVVSHCWFHDTNSDALDLDISTATVEHCKVERAGNDGFDLMTCSPRIIGNEIRDNLDKGISVGENSSPFVFANTITGCKRGIEVKDRSAPVILNDTIEKNGVGILARLKNWRYERGGWPRLVRSSVVGNKTNLELEAKTRLTPLDVRLGDAGEESRTSSSLDWLYALNGVAIDAASIGSVPTWRSVPHAVLFEEESFPDTWSAPEATWKISGGVTSLRVSEECLVVRMNARAGALRRKVDWHLIDPATTNWLVLETSSTELESVRVRVEGQDLGDQPHTLANGMELADGTSSFAWTVVPLPAGIFGSLSLEITPRSRESITAERRLLTNGQLRLHRWFIVQALTADLGPAK
ncbi:MAG TPA: right-handed parallel beta-helix repeat-containing protein, partial [Planctomycetota bacterium]|nr:right-handed parallel beta-helix repeat-containing protein [Planctomycetota bacterium]